MQITDLAPYAPFTEASSGPSTELLRELRKSYKAGTARQYLYGLRRLIRDLPGSDPHSPQLLAVFGALPGPVQSNVRKTWPYLEAWASAQGLRALPGIPGASRKPRQPRAEPAASSAPFQADPLPHSVVFTIAQACNHYPRALRALQRLTLADLDIKLKGDTPLGGRSRRNIPQSMLWPILRWSFALDGSPEIPEHLKGSPAPVLCPRPGQGEQRYPLDLLVPTMEAYWNWERGLYLSSGIAGFSGPNEALSWEETVYLLWSFRFPRHLTAWEHRVQNQKSRQEAWHPRQRTELLIKQAHWQCPTDRLLTADQASALLVTQRPVAAAPEPRPALPPAPVPMLPQPRATETTAPSLPSPTMAPAELRPTGRVQLDDSLEGLPMPE